MKRDVGSFTDAWADLPYWMVYGLLLSFGFFLWIFADAVESGRYLAATVWLVLSIGSLVVLGRQVWKRMDLPAAERIRRRSHPS